MDNQFKFLNKKISTLIGASIVLITVIFGIVILDWKCWGLIEDIKEISFGEVFEKEKDIKEEEPAGKTDDLLGETLKTEDWETYKNEEYRFEIKYPSDWEFVDCTDEFDKSERDFERKISFISPMEPPLKWIDARPPDYEEQERCLDLIITVYKKSEWEKYDPCEGMKDTDYCDDLAIFDDISAVTWSDVTPISEYVVIRISKDQFVVLIETEFGSSPWEIEEFNQILSTFKFSG